MGKVCKRMVGPVEMLTASFVPKMAKTGGELLKNGLDLPALLAKAKEAGQKAADEYWVKVMKKRDMDAIGFVWLEVPAQWAGPKLCKLLLEAGFSKTKSYGTTVYQYQGFRFDLKSQGMCLEETAYKAAAHVFWEAGFGDNISMRSRMD